LIEDIEIVHFDYLFFAFQISPVRSVKSAGSAVSVEQEEDQKAVLVLKPFAAKPRMVFKDVLVSSVSSQCFTIQNPDPSDVTVN